MSSGVAAWSMVVRNTIETVSAYPARARKNSPSQRLRVSPNTAMASPHAATASRIASPCRRTRACQPENSPPSSAPAAIAATIRPTVFASSPYQSTAMAGNSAFGCASTMAAMSVKKVIRMLGRVPRKRSPSATEALPALPRPGRASWTAAATSRRARR